MIVFEITNNREDHDLYRMLEAANGTRHYDFLRSMVEIALASDYRHLSAIMLKALNFHAIACLHTNAGQYRPCQVEVGVHRPPLPHRVGPLMDDLINEVNRKWETVHPVTLACYALWRINYIHPFINGNGRTARAAAYFILCVSAGVWLPGKKILPELIREVRQQYVEALVIADTTYTQTGEVNLQPLVNLIGSLLMTQFESESESDAPADDPANPTEQLPA